jgi:hypothetical protein
MANDPVGAGIGDHGLLLRRSGLCALPLPRQLAQAADHQLGPRSPKIIEALGLQLGQQPALRCARPRQQRADSLALPRARLLVRVA